MFEFPNLELNFSMNYGLNHIVMLTYSLSLGSKLRSKYEIPKKARIRQ